MISAGREAEVVARVAVGDAVVYASHGIGRVVAREQKVVAGTKRECIVIDLAAGLRVTLPLDEAADRLRPVLNGSALAAVQKTLSEKPRARDGSWTRRIKESKAKLTSGQTDELAELVRDGARHEANGGPRLSTGERRIYVQARQLLVGEICAARGVEQDEAEEWIEAQIALPDESGD